MFSRLNVVLNVDALSHGRSAGVKTFRTRRYDSTLRHNYRMVMVVSATEVET